LVFLHVIVLLLAAARAAWLAVVVVAIVGYVVGKVTRRSGRTKTEPLRGGFRMAVGSIVVVLIALAVSPELSDSLQSRIAGVSGGRTEVGAMARQQQNNSLLELESLAPWTGLGLSASGRVGVSGRIGYIGTSKNNIASNWLLGWWVDGGLFAIPIILLFLGAAARRVTVTSGLLLGIVLVSSLFSNATLIPISWLALAMCLMRTTPNDPDPPPELKPEPKPEPRAEHIEAAEPAALEVARVA
jgi:O-antigen ligase